MADSADSSGEETPSKKRTTVEVLELESPNKKRAVEEEPLVIPNEQLKAQQRLQTLRRVPVKSGRRSNIWKALPKGFSTYSSHANANLKHIVVCNTCMDNELFEQAEINYGKTMSTTNIKNHVHSHHKDVYGKLLLANEIGAVEVEAMAKKGVTDIANFFKQVPQAHVCLQKLIVNKHLPIDLVEDADFRGFAEGLSQSQTG